MASKGFFSSLHRLAVKLDKETRSLQEQMSNPGSNANTEEATLLLHQLRKEITVLQHDLREKLQDFRKSSKDFTDLVPLCQSVIVQQAERLANIEDYLAKYGYRPPDPSRSSEEMPSGGDDDNDFTQHNVKPEMTETAEPKDRNNQHSEDKGDSHKAPRTPKVQPRKDSDSGEERTPQPEDFGVNLGNIMRRFVTDSSLVTPAEMSRHQAPRNSCDTPQTFQHSGLSVTPGILGHDIGTVTPAFGKNVSRNGKLYPRACPSKAEGALDKTPEFPTLHTPGFNKLPKKRQVESEENTMTFFTENKKGNQAAAATDCDGWDDSPIPPVLTSGVVRLPEKMTDRLQMLKKPEEISTDEDSPVPPILMTPAAKKFCNKNRPHSILETSSSDDSSPIVPELTTPGFKIPSKYPVKPSKSTSKGAESEVNSPEFPELQTRKVDASDIELPPQPSVGGVGSWDDEEMPDVPELKTINFQILAAQMNQVSVSSGEADTPSSQQPRVKSKSKSVVPDSNVPEGKENRMSQLGNLTKDVPERLKPIQPADYASLPPYLARQLSCELMNKMASQLNIILAQKNQANEDEHTSEAELHRYFGAKTKIFILAMRHLGKFAVKSKGYVVT